MHNLGVGDFDGVPAQCVVKIDSGGATRGGHSHSFSHRRLHIEARIGSALTRYGDAVCPRYRGAAVVVENGLQRRPVRIGIGNQPVTVQQARDAVDSCATLRTDYRN